MDGEKTWTKFKNLAIVIGFLVDAVVIFGWFGIDQSSIESTASTVFYVSAPFVIAVSSFFIGWQLCRRKALREMKTNSGGSKTGDVYKSFANSIYCPRFKSARPEKKIMAAVIYKSPKARIAVDSNAAYSIKMMDKRSIHGATSDPFFQFDDKGNGLVYVELAEWVKELFDAAPEMADDFPHKSLEECVDYLEAHKPSFD